MRYTGKQVVHPGVRAGDLPALMELYELNYIQLRRLVPDLDAVQQRSVSKLTGALDLYLTILERTRYTTTLNLSYRFAGSGTSYLAPDVQVRVYHDAQLAEVLSHSRRHGRANGGQGPSHARYALQTKWQMNRFLHKWLGYCLHQGHGFSPARERLSEALQSIEDEQALSLES